MQVLVFLLFVAVIVGGSRRAQVVRQHPILLLGFTLVIAVSFYSLRVIT